MVEIEGNNSDLKKITTFLNRMGMENISQPWDNIIIGNTILLTSNNTYYFGTSSANWSRQITLIIKNIEFFYDEG